MSWPRIELAAQEMAGQPIPAQPIPASDSTPLMASPPLIPGPPLGVHPVSLEPDPAQPEPDFATAPDPIFGAEPQPVFAADPDDPSDEPAVESATADERARVALLDTEVLVLDGRPRYHLADCRHLVGRDEPEPLPVSEAEELGFTPCSLCAPLHTLLAH